MTKLKIKVRKAHIDNGKVRDSHHCMIADAIHEACKDARYVVVDLQSIRWSNLKTGERFTAFTPAKAQKALIEFDQGVKPQPFMFTAHVALVKKVGWQANHPKGSRKGKKYNKTGIKGLKGAKPARYREFGIRQLTK